MSFSVNSTVITQTGTDTACSGLNGLAGVTRLDLGRKQVYVIDNKRMDVSGNFSYNSSSELLMFKDSSLNNLIRVQSGGEFSLSGTVSNSFSANSINSYTTGLILTTNNLPACCENGSITVENGGTFNLTECSIEIGSVIEFKITSNINLTNCRIFCNRYRLTNSVRIRQKSTFFKCENLECIGISMDMFQIPLKFTGYSCVLARHAIEFLDAANQSVLKNFNPKDNKIDLENYNTNIIFSYNMSQGTNHIFSNYISGKTIVVGREIRFTVQEFLNNTFIENCKIYSVDTNNSQRKATDIGGISDSSIKTTKNIVYNFLTDSSGETPESLIYIGFYYDSTMDKRGIGNEDNFKFIYCSYNHLFQEKTLNLKGLYIYEDKSVLFIDSNISEKDPSIVRFYTKIDTSEKLYDFAKYYLWQNFKGETETLVFFQGDHLNLRDLNLTINKNATSVFKLTGSNLVIKTDTFTGSLITNGIITNTSDEKYLDAITDSTGTTSLLTLTKLIDTFVYVENDQGNKYEYHTNITGELKITVKEKENKKYKVLLVRKGYKKNELILNTKNISEHIEVFYTKLLDTDGSPMYKGIASQSIVFSYNNDKITGTLSGDITAQFFFDGLENFLATEGGCQWLLRNNLNQPNRLNLSFGGEFLNMPENINISGPGHSINAFIESKESPFDISINGNVVFNILSLKSYDDINRNLNELKKIMNYNQNIISSRFNKQKRQFQLTHSNQGDLTDASNNFFIEKGNINTNNELTFTSDKKLILEFTLDPNIDYGKIIFSDFDITQNNCINPNVVAKATHDVKGELIQELVLLESYYFSYENINIKNMNMIVDFQEYFNDINGFSKIKFEFSCEENNNIFFKINKVKILEKLHYEKLLENKTDSSDLLILDNIESIKTETDAIKLETDKIAAVKTETDKIAAVKTETDKIAAVKTETDKIAAVKTETDKIATVKTETDKIATVKTETDKIAAVKTETDKIATVKTETDKIATVKTETAAIKLETDKIKDVKTETSAIKAQTDLIQFTSDKDIKATLDGEETKADIQKVKGKNINDVGDFKASSFDLSTLDPKFLEIKTETDKIKDVKTDTAAIKLETNKIAAVKTETDKIAAIKTETDKIAEIKTETDKIAAVKTETDKIATVKTETDKIAAVKTETDKIAAVKTETDKIATVKTETDKIATVKTETDKIAAVKTETDKIATVKTETDKIATVKTETAAIKLETDKIKDVKTETSAIKAQTDLIQFTSDKDIKATLDGEETKADIQKVKGKNINDVGDFKASSFDLSTLDPKFLEIKTETDKIKDVKTDTAAIKIETDKIEAVKTETAAIKLETNKIAAVKTETDKIATVKTETDKIATVKTETDKIAAVKTETDKIAAVKTETDKIATVKTETDKIAAVKTETDKIATVKTETDKIAAVKTETDKIATVKTETAAIKLETDKIKDVKTETSAIKAQTDLIQFTPDNDIKATLDGEETKADIQKVKGKNINDVGDFKASSFDLSTLDPKFLEIKTETDKIKDVKTDTAAIKIETDKIEAVKTETAAIKLETNKIAAVKTETDKIATVKTETDKIAAVKTETDKIAAVKTETDKIATVKTETDKIAAVKTETDKIATVKTETDKIAAVKTETDKIATVKTETAAIKLETDKIKDVKTETSAIKAQTDLIQFTPDNDIKATLDGEETKADIQKVKGKNINDVGDFKASSFDLSTLDPKFLEIKTETDKIKDVKTDTAAIKIETDKIEAVKTETAAIKLETNKIAAVKTETDKIAAIKTETDKIAEIKTETDKIAAVKTETDKIATVKTETDKIATVKTETDKIVAVKTETDKIAEIKTETDKIAAVKTETTKIEDIKKKTDELTFIEGDIQATLDGEEIFPHIKVENTVDLTPIQNIVDEIRTQTDKLTFTGDNINAEIEAQIEIDSLKQTVNDMKDQTNLIGNIKDTTDQIKFDDKNNIKSTLVGETISANIEQVKGTTITDIEDFKDKANLSTITSKIDLIKDETDKIDSIHQKTNKIIFNDANHIKSTIAGEQVLANIQEVKGTPITDIEDFKDKANLSDITSKIDLIKNETDKIDSIQEKTNKMTFDKTNHIQSTLAGEQVLANIQEVKGTPITNIEDFKDKANLLDITSKLDSVKAKTDTMNFTSDNDIRATLDGEETSANIKKVQNIAISNIGDFKDKADLNTITTTINSVKDKINKIKFDDQNNIKSTLLGETISANIEQVKGIPVTDISNFKDKADLTDITTAITDIKTQTDQIQFTPDKDIKATLDGEETLANIKKVQDTPVADINAFKDKTELNTITTELNSVKDQTDKLNFDTQDNIKSTLSGETISANIEQVKGNPVTDISDFKDKADLTNIKTAINDIKNQTDQIQFTPDKDIKATLDGEETLANIKKVQDNPVADINAFKDKADLNTITTAINSIKEQTTKMNFDDTDNIKATLVGAVISANIKEVQGNPVAHINDFKEKSNLTEITEKIDSIKLKTDKMNFSSANDILSTLDGEEAAANIIKVHNTPVTDISEFTDKANFTEITDKIDGIKSQTDKIQFTDVNDIKATLDGEETLADIKKVKGTVISDISEFQDKADLTNLTNTINDIKTQTDQIQFTANKDIKATLDGEETLANIQQVKGSPITNINDFKDKADLTDIKTDISDIKTQTDKMKFASDNDIVATLDGENISSSISILKEDLSAALQDSVVDANIIKVGGVNIHSPADIGLDDPSSKINDIQTQVEDIKKDTEDIKKDTEHLKEESEEIKEIAKATKDHAQAADVQTQVLDL